MTSWSSQPECGHESEWAQHALGLKSLPDAIAARNRLLKAFERADMESDPVKQAREMTVGVVGGGRRVSQSRELSASSCNARYTLTFATSTSAAPASS
jgi:hypothetical protein